jgi:hypothetical protein
VSMTKIKTLVDNFAWKRATGLLHTDDTLVISRIDVSAVGKKRTESEVVELSDFESEPEPLIAALKHLREAGKLPGPIICGIDPRGIYSVTRQSTDDEKDVSAAEIVSAQIGALEGGLAAAMINAKLPSGTFRSITAVSKWRAKQLLAGLEGVKSRLLQLPPMSHIILRAAMAAGKKPRRWNSVIRVIPGKNYGVALLTVGDSLVAWRMFAPGRNGKLSKGRAEQTLLGLLSHASKDLLLDRVDGCLLHVGEDAVAYEQMAEGLSSNLDLDVRRSGACHVDNESIAESLATWGLAATVHELDLFQDLQPKSGLAENFPRKAAGSLSVAIMLFGLLLWNEATTIEDEVAAIERVANQDAKRAKIKLDKVKKEHEVLGNEFMVANNFVSKRVFWEDLLRELPLLLPPAMRVVRIEAFDGVQLTNKTTAATKKTKFQLTTEMLVDDPNGGTPPEVQAFTLGLRESEQFGKTFPRISSANVRIQELKGGIGQVKLQVTCKPGSG